MQTNRENGSFEDRIRKEVPADESLHRTCNSFVLVSYSQTLHLFALPQGVFCGEPFCQATAVSTPLWAACRVH